SCVRTQGGRRATVDRSNFIIGADRIRRCLIASCCAGNVIARRIGYAAGKRRGASKFSPGGRRGGSQAEKSKTNAISICVRRTPESGHVRCKRACPLYPRKRHPLVLPAYQRHLHTRDSTP